MIMQNISKTLCRIFSIILTVSLFCVFICILIFGYRSPEVSSVTEKTGIILAFGVMTAAAISVYYLLSNSNNRLCNFTLTSKQTNVIIFVFVGIMFVIQLFVGYELRANAINDLSRIDDYSYDFAVNGNFDLIQQHDVIKRMGGNKQISFSSGSASDLRLEN